MTPRAKVMTFGDRKVDAAHGPTVGAGVMRGLLELAVRKGADRVMLVKQSGVELNALYDPDARIAVSTYIDLMRAGQRLAKDPALALHYAEEVDLSEVSIVGLIVHTCETMGDAFAQLARYSRLVTEHDEPRTIGRFQRQPAGEGLHWLVDTRSNPNAFPEASEVALARLALGPRIFDTTPFCREAHFTHSAPSYRNEYERIFQAPVFFESDKNALLIPDSWSSHKIAPRQGYAFGVLCAHADGLMASLGQLTTVRGRVEGALMSILHKGVVTVDAVAANMGISRRTLARRLKAEATTYEAVLDELRLNLALNYLEGLRVSVTETSYLLGFSDPASFSRAFKRWTGSSPRGKVEKKQRDKRAHT